MNIVRFPYPIGKSGGLFMLLVLLVLVTATTPLVAQDTVILSLTVPELNEDNFTDVIGEFEAQHPGIEVRLITFGGFSIPFGGEDTIDEYLDDVEDYVSSADVLLVDSALSVEATRAGYFLGLSPLVNSDPSLNIDDFYPALWQSFQWDMQIWALPLAGQVTVWFYDPAVFDEDGVPYPESWLSVADVDYAARSLVKYDADGNVTVPGLLPLGGGQNALLVSLLGDGIYDDSILPGMPNFGNPELEPLLTTWAAMQTDGLMSMSGDVDFSALPLLMANTAMGRFGPNDDSSNYVGALLPGGVAGVEATGVAISTGTQYPELAYELAKFLTYSPETSMSFFTSTPARRSLGDASVDNQGGPGGGPGGGRFNNNLSPEMEALVQDGLEYGIPFSKTLLMDDLMAAVNLMVQDGLDVTSALQTVESDILTRLETADARHDTVQVQVINAPVAPLAPGEIALKFGVSASVSPFPNQDKWESAALDFAANDPEVGRVDMEFTFSGRGGGDLTTMTTDYDCFYLSNNAVPNADLSLLRSIDPLLDSDPTFNPDDIVGNALSQVQSNNQTWALPYTIQPLALRYGPDSFNYAGVMLPQNGWTVDEFEAALRALKVYPDDPIPLSSMTFDNAYLLNLIAAYGGVPLDYRTDPMTINFTDPATVEAIRQVLDLARDGYIDYHTLVSRTRVVVNPDEVPITTEVVGGLGGPGMFFRRGGGGASAEEEDSYLLTTFPTGALYSAVSYDISAAYISAETESAEACYRLMRDLGQNVELFDSMPAYRSLINSPELLASQGADTVTFYNTLDALTQQPNTINIPMQSGGGIAGGMLTTYWLNRAFDRYVLEDADLDTELAEAEMYTQSFEDCTAALPAFDPAIDDRRVYFGQFRDCATQADPTAADFFGG